MIFIETEAGTQIIAFDTRSSVIDVQAAVDEIGLIPAQRTQFGCSQTMPEGRHDHGGVTMPMPIVCRRLHEPFDLALGEYSRVRYSAFGNRRGGTVPFTVLGARERGHDFIENFACAIA